MLCTLCPRLAFAARGRHPHCAANIPARLWAFRRFWGALMRRRETPSATKYQSQRTERLLSINMPIHRLGSPRNAPTLRRPSPASARLRSAWSGPQCVDVRPSRRPARTPVRRFAPRQAGPRPERTPRLSPGAERQDLPRLRALRVNETAKVRSNRPPEPRSGEPPTRIQLRVIFCAAGMVVNGTCAAGPEAP
jgi:hypothetical protein